MSDTNWLELVLKAATPTLIAIGGLYAMFEYWRFRRYGHRAQLDVDFDVIPIPSAPGSYMLDIRAIIKNLGLVRQEFPVIDLWASDLRDSDIEKAKKGDGRLGMRNRILERRNISDPSDPYFVDPSVRQVFSYQAAIKTGSSHVKVVVCFYYPISWLAIPAARWRTKRQLQKVRDREDEKRAKVLEEKLERLKKYRVYWFHTATAVKPVPQPSQ